MMASDIYTFSLIGRKNRVNYTFFFRFCYIGDPNAHNPTYTPMSQPADLWCGTVIVHMLLKQKYAYIFSKHMYGYIGFVVTTDLKKKIVNERLLGYI